MISEKECNIIKALVEEEIQSLRTHSEFYSHDIVTQYLCTLTSILEKLKDTCSTSERRPRVQLSRI